MKKFWCILLTVIFAAGCLFAFSACGSDTKYGAELIQNGGFELSTTTLSYWKELKAVTSDTDGVLATKTYTDGDKNGETYLTVTNGRTSGNYIQLYQTIAVEKNAYYKISALIRNENLSTGSGETMVGGGVGFLESNVQIVSTDITVLGEWVEYTAYIKAKTKEVNFTLTFGSSDNYTVGEVWFDDVSMTRVKAKDIPQDAIVTSITAPRDKDYANSSPAGTAMVSVFAILTALLIFGAWYAYRRLVHDDAPFFKKTWITALTLVVAGIGIRLIFAGTLFGSAGAAGLQATLKAMVDGGGSNIIFNYPQYAPFQVYYLWICGKIVGDMSSLASINVITHLFPIIAEGVTIGLIYLFSKKYVNDKQAVLFASLYALLPVSLIISSGYSIEIPVLIALLAVTFWALIEKKFILMTVASLFAVLWSPIGLYVVPFIVAYEVYLMVKNKNKKNIITICVCWFAAFWLFILLSAPAVKTMFRLGHIMYIFKSYYLMLFDSQVCVSNAFNLYALFGLNGSSVNTAAFWLNIVFSIILIVYSVSLYFKNFNRAEMTLLAGFFLTVMAVFSLNMNENALAIGLILLLMYIIISGEERLFWVFGVLAVLAFANSGIIMNYSGVLGTNFAYTYFNKGDGGYAVANVLAACTVLYYAWVVYDVTTNGKVKMLKPLTYREDKVSK